MIEQAGSPSESSPSTEESLEPRRLSLDMAPSPFKLILNSNPDWVVDTERNY